MTLQSRSRAYIQRKIVQKDPCTPVFTAALFSIAKTQKQPKCPSADEWIKKMWYICTVKYYSAIKKNKMLPFAATCSPWMDLEIVILNEVNQTEKEKYFNIPYMQNLKRNYTNELYKTETDSEA